MIRLPFVSARAFNALQEQVKRLEEMVMNHSTATAQELHKLKNPVHHVRCTLGEPLSPEQEEIVKEFSKNRQLPEQIRRHFASGGPVGMRAALGRFGEAPSEQTRSTDPAVYAYDPDEPVPSTRVDVTFGITGTQSAEQIRNQVRNAMHAVTNFSQPKEPGFSDLRRFALESELELRDRGFLRNAPFELRTEKTPGAYEIPNDRAMAPSQIISQDEPPKE